MKKSTSESSETSMLTNYTISQIGSKTKNIELINRIIDLPLADIQREVEIGSCRRAIVTKTRHPVQLLSLKIKLITQATASPNRIITYTLGLCTKVMAEVVT